MTSPARPSDPPTGERAATPRHNLLTAPNLLSLTRILLVPLLVAVLLTETRFQGKELVALAVFLLASLTDFLDGYLARKRGQVTRLGKLLDPAADKILTSSAFISLVGLGLAPAWMVVVILAREFGVSALRSLAASDRIVLSAIGSAKLKTGLQVAAIGGLILSLTLPVLGPLAYGLLWVAMLASLYSGVEYFVRYGPLLLGRGAG